MEDLEKLKMDLSMSYAAKVSSEQARKIKKEIFSDYGKVVDFDLRKEADEAISFMIDYHDGDLGLILRGFEEADEEVKEEISTRIKGFYERRSFSSDVSTDILIVDGGTPVKYCPELGMRVVSMYNKS